MRYLLPLFGLLWMPVSVWASPLSDDALRRQLALTYAPEIRQDRRERYGIASIPYFLHQSVLKAQLRGCSRAQRRKTPVIRLGAGRWLSVRNRFRWRTSGCQASYNPFAVTRSSTPQGEKVWPAPSNLFLQLRRHDARSLLRDHQRFAVAPEVSFRVYERQVQRCVRRNWAFLCKHYKVRRFYVVQYFVPLMYNDACNVHEGEHEGMVVLVDAWKYDTAKDDNDRQEAIVRVGYYGHYKTKVVKRDEVTFVQTTHPVAYMGSLGHALYPKPGVTKMLASFPFEVRPWIRRICKKRGRLEKLDEWHRGEGPVYRTWRAAGKPDAIIKRNWTSMSRTWRHLRGIFWPGMLSEKPPTSGPLSPPTPPERTPTSKPVVRRTPTSRRTPSPQKPAGRWDPLSPLEKKQLAQVKAFTPACLVGQAGRSVRLCDVQQSANNPVCCLNRRWKRVVRWASFAGRWGSQEPFASGLVGAAAARLGAIMRRWPLARSMGNSGPFGPRWIHQHTWLWKSPPRPPSPTPTTWR